MQRFKQQKFKVKSWQLRENGQMGQSLICVMEHKEGWTLEAVFALIPEKDLEKAPGPGAILYREENRLNFPICKIPDLPWDDAAKQVFSPTHEKDTPFQSMTAPASTAVDFLNRNVRRMVMDGVVPEYYEGKDYRIAKKVSHVKLAR